MACDSDHSQPLPFSRMVDASEAVALTPRVGRVIVATIPMRARPLVRPIAAIDGAAPFARGDHPMSTGKGRRGADAEELARLRAELAACRRDAVVASEQVALR